METTPTAEEAHAKPGLFLAGHLGGVWHPLPADLDEEGVSGHLELDGVYLYFGMGYEESGGDWLQIAYLYAKPRLEPLDEVDHDDTSACGRGVGTKAVHGLRAWTEHTGTPHRFIAIENPGFFARFDDWSDANFVEAEPDGECWYYPSAGLR